jgi:sugar/nucleoside kinase (ribokinase family)
MVDVVVKVASLPVRGGDALATDRLVSAGGGFNAMAAARRQGVAVSYLGKCGRGPFADVARRQLDDEGVDLAPIAPSDEDAGLCFVFVEDDGERSFVTSPGAEQRVTGDELCAVPLSPGDVVFLSGYNFVYPEIRAAFTTWLSALDDAVTLAFDPGPRVLDIDHDVLSLVLARTDWLLCNDGEATAMCGAPSSEEAARRLASRTRGARVVVRTGARGCDAVVDARALHVDAFPTRVLDTNGAGDAHNGVFLAELLRGAGVVDALTRANAGASVAISTLGPATCPSRAVIDGLLGAG